MGSPAWPLDQPVGSWSRPLDQSVVNEVTGSTRVSQTLAILPSALVEGQDDEALWPSFEPEMSFIDGCASRHLACSGSRPKEC